MVLIKKESVKNYLQTLGEDREWVVDEMVEDCYQRIESSKDDHYKVHQLQFMDIVLKAYYEIKK